ncbi:hypothetical protein XENORESO_004026, partial [Xenotaenia resolanae]
MLCNHCIRYNQFLFDAYYHNATHCVSFSNNKLIYQQTEASSNNSSISSEEVCETYPNVLFSPFFFLPVRTESSSGWQWRCEGSAHSHLSPLCSISALPATFLKRIGFENNCFVCRCVCVCVC